MEHPFFISVDWGTSNFRMRVVESATLAVREEVTAPAGVKVLHERWSREGGDREGYFIDFLEQQRLRLRQPDLAGTAVISGMASSDIGLRELPYVPLPVGIGGEGFLVKKIRHPGCRLDIRLVSGLCTACDIMRGEETQLAGLSPYITDAEEAVVVLPGTHSKHIICRGGRLTDFTTFLTGELFDILVHHSMLKSSVEHGSVEPFQAAAFEQGVRESLGGAPLLQSLFRIRAKDRLSGGSPAKNYYYLSGLVIGAEMAALAGYGPAPVFLAAGAGMGVLYESALRLCIDSRQLHVLPASVVDRAVVAGHASLLVQ